MALLIVVNKEYKDDGAVYEQLFQYITRQDKAIQGLTGSQYLYPVNDATDIGNQMREVNLLNSNNGRALWHFILSFDHYNEYYITSITAYNIGRKILAFVDGHQAVYAVHEDTGNLHIHFMVNATDFYNGRKIENKRETFESIAGLCQTIILDTEEGQKRLYCSVCYHMENDI